MNGPPIAQVSSWAAPGRTRTEAYDGVRFLFVHTGEVRAWTDVGEVRLRAGDVLVVSPNHACGFGAPHHARVQTLLIDLVYLIDQVFWQHAAGLHDRLHALSLVEEAFPDPVIVLHLSDDAHRKVRCWLHALARLGTAAALPERFYAVQAAIAGLMDALVPFFGSLPYPGPTSRVRDTGLRRVPAAAAAMRLALEDSPQEVWPLSRLAALAHLSPSRAHHVFTTAYEVTPHVFHSMLRTREMARLLRETSLSVAEVVAAVGWADRSHAAAVFRRFIGANPAAYRRAMQ